MVGILVASVLTVGCGGPSSTRSSGGPTQGDHPSFNPRQRDFQRVRALLATRARAVRQHDVGAFLATVDQRDQAFVTQQRTLFDNMSQLRIASLRYVMDPSVELVPADVPGGDPVFRPQVYEFLQIAGTMTHPVSNPLEQTFVERGGHWLVGAETTASDNESFDSAQERPWFGVPIVARRLGPMTVLVDRSQEQTLAPLTAAIHSDIDFDAARLGIAPSSQILVDATSNGNATSFSSLSDEQAAAVTFALTEGEPKDPETFESLAGHAIKINPHDAGAYVQDAGLLRHELTHFLLHEYSGSNPMWLVEGVAEWTRYYPDDFSAERIPADLFGRLQSADRALPVLGLFDDDPDVNYPISQAAVTYLVSHYGMPRLLRLMQAYRNHYAGVDTDALTPRMLRLVYGIGEQQVVQGAFQLLGEYQH